MRRLEHERFFVDRCSSRWFQRASVGLHLYLVGHPRSESRTACFTPRKCFRCNAKYQEMPNHFFFHPGSGPDPPLRFKAVINLVSRSHYLLWYSTDTICPGADIVQLLRGHRASVAPNATGIRTIVTIFEPRRRSKIKRSICAGFPQRMSILKS